MALLRHFCTSFSQKQLEKVDISTVIERANAGKITKIQGQGNDLEITPEGSDKATERSYFTGGVAALLRDDILNERGRKVVSDTPPSQTSETLWNLAIIIIPVLLIAGFFLFMMRQAQGQNNQAMGFGKSKAKLYGTDKEKVVFADIAGNESAKQDLEEVVDFLKHPKKYEELGAKIPKVCYLSVVQVQVRRCLRVR